MSVLSSYWEWSTINHDFLYYNLPSDYRVTSFQGGKLLIVQKEKEEFVPQPWLNNPNVMANTVSGLWSSCLFLDGGKEDCYYNEIIDLLRLGISEYQVQLDLDWRQMYRP